MWVSGRPAPWRRAGAPGWRRADARRLAGARLDLLLLRVRQEHEPVGELRELGEHARELVVDERVALAVAQLRLVLDLVLLVDVLDDEPVELVDRVDDDG